MTKFAPIGNGGKFAVAEPFRLYEEDTYQGKPSTYSNFITDLVRAQIDMGGIPVEVYRWTGTVDQYKDFLGTKNKFRGTEEALDVGSFMGLQDPLLGENRDRTWDFDTIPTLRGVYQISEFTLEYAKLAGNLSVNDVLTVEFHIGEMERLLGRRIIPGDVVKLAHLKDIGPDGRIRPRYYEIKSATWAPGGYDPTWGRHIYAAILKPLRYQQEFLEFFEREDEYGNKLADSSNKDAIIAVNAAIQDAAISHAKTTGMDTTLLWYDPAQPKSVPNLFIDDAIPPNGYVPVGRGDLFPSTPQQNDWYVRTDMMPNRLYQYVGTRWRSMEVDKKRAWGTYNWIEPMQKFMSTRSAEDRARKHKLRSIHDVLTAREAYSDPIEDQE